MSLKQQTAETINRNGISRATYEQTNPSLPAGKFKPLIVPERCVQLCVNWQ